MLFTFYKINYFNFIIWYHSFCYLSAIWSSRISHIHIGIICATIWWARAHLIQAEAGFGRCWQKWVPVLEWAPRLLTTTTNSVDSDSILILIHPQKWIQKDLLNIFMVFYESLWLQIESFIERRDHLFILQQTNQRNKQANAINKPMQYAKQFNSQTNAINKPMQ